VRAANLRFPVRCPICGFEQLAEFPAMIIAEALMNGQPLQLYADCHDQKWNASKLELEQAAKYLRAARLQAIPDQDDFAAQAPVLDDMHAQRRTDPNPH
jgi:hypothetical protein